MVEEEQQRSQCATAAMAAVTAAVAQRAAPKQAAPWNAWQLVSKSTYQCRYQCCWQPF
jgi:hypothetical protein